MIEGNPFAKERMNRYFFSRGFKYKRVKNKFVRIKVTATAYRLVRNTYPSLKDEDKIYKAYTGNRFYSELNKKRRSLRARVIRNGLRKNIRFYVKIYNQKFHYSLFKEPILF